MNEKLIKRTIEFTSDDIVIHNYIDYKKTMQIKIKKFEKLSFKDIIKINKELIIKLSTIDLTTIEDEILSNIFFNVLISSMFINKKNNLPLKTNIDLAEKCIDELVRRNIDFINF